MIRSCDTYTTKFPGTLSRASYLGRPLETRDGSSNSHKMLRICERVANDEKIDRNLILKAPLFMKIRVLESPRVRREYCDLDSTISHTFSVRVWRNEVCGTVPPDFQTLAASNVRSWDASRFSVVRKTAGLATFERKERSK